MGQYQRVLHMYNYMCVAERQDKIMEKRICVETVAKICLNLVKINL